MPAEQLFSLGEVFITPGADEALTDAGHLPNEFLGRHAVGDWGEIDEHDRQINEFSVRNSLRILSAYRTRKDARLWIITEATRESIIILLPEEY